MKFKVIIWLLLITFVSIIVLNVKPIGRHIYTLKYEEYISKYSQEYDLDPYLVAALIKTESKFNKDVKSKRDAYGLMQITSSTAQWAAGEMKIDYSKPELLYDAEYNIRMGCWYLNDLKKEFNGNMDVVLAAYNGGRGNVEKWLKDSEHSSDGQNLDYIPFKETDKYVKKVNTNHKIYKFLYKNI